MPNKSRSSTVNTDAIYFFVCAVKTGKGLEIKSMLYRLEFYFIDLKRVTVRPVTMCVNSLYNKLVFPPNTLLSKYKPKGRLSHGLQLVHSIIAVIFLIYFCLVFLYHFC